MWQGIKAQVIKTKKGGKMTKPSKEVKAGDFEEEEIKDADEWDTDDMLEEG